MRTFVSDFALELEPRVPGRWATGGWLCKSRARRGQAGDAGAELMSTGIAEEVVDVPGTVVDGRDSSGTTWTCKI